MARPRTKPRAPKVPAFTGDHGTGTKAAMEGTELRPIEGSNPNRVGRRQRINQIDKLAPALSMRQTQAAKAIEAAYCRVQMLSSGGEMKAKVDASPKPDATVGAQVDAQSVLVHVMRKVPSEMRPVVEAVCWHNRPISSVGKGRAFYDHTANLKVALDLVANHMRY